MAEELSFFKRISPFFTEVGELTRFAGRFFKEAFSPPVEFREFIRQCYNVGNKSLLLVSVTGFILGVVFTLQSRPTLEEFGAVAWIPTMVSISIVREIGPVIIALVVAGRIGSGFAAELGSMKVTEQIDAMEVSGTNPFNYLVVTRIMATIFMIPLLVIFGDFIALTGSAIVENIKGGISFELFFIKTFNALRFRDLLPATVKTFLFGFAIGLVGCFKGMNSKKGTSGVGKASNSAVVYSSMLIFILDFLAVLVTDILY